MVSMGETFELVNDLRDERNKHGTEWRGTNRAICIENGFSSSDEFSADEDEFDETFPSFEKKKKKKKKKQPRSDKKKKKKTKKKEEGLDDDDHQSYNFDKFTTPPSPLKPEQAPPRNNNSTKKKKESKKVPVDDDEWIVESNCRGQNMSDYLKKMCSIDSLDTGFNYAPPPPSSARSVSAAGKLETIGSFSSRRSSSSTITSRESKSSGGNSKRGKRRSVSMRVPKGFSSQQSAASSTIQEEEEENCDAHSVHSDITGLTGVFSNMPSHFDDSEDDDEDNFDNIQALAYPRYELRRMSAKRKVAKKLSVTFSTVSIRKYKRILSDNPSCKSGPSLGIGWQHTAEVTVGLEEYAQKRGPVKPACRLVLDRVTRENMLLELGYTQKDIATAVRAAVREKNRRRQTVNNLGASKMEETLESVGKGIKSVLSFNKRKN